MHPISHTFNWSKGINQSPKHGMHTKNPSQIVGDYVQIKILTFKNKK
jgi:hypothetical protein